MANAALAGYRLHALVVAGGSGARFGTEVPKQFLLLGGRPILAHTLDRFLQFDNMLQLTLVLPAAHLDYWAEKQRTYLDAASIGRIALVAGGSSRTESVWNGLQAISAECPANQDRALVAVQDAVRPFTNPEMVATAYQSAAKYGSGVACVPSKSSLRRKTEGGSEAVDRAAYFAVQTPQTFRLDWLLKAYSELREGSFTDDASLLEAAGYAIHLVDGAYDNLKVTTPEDLQLAEILLPEFMAKWYPAGT